MVVALTNDKVYVYDIDEFLYINITSDPDFKSTDLDEYKVYDLPKGMYTPIRMSKDLGERLARIKFFYYDNGREMVRKEVNDVFDIKYYEDDAGELWASKEYYQYVNSNVSTNIKYAEIIALDNELNACKHLQTLLSLSAIEEFKRYYDSDSKRQYAELSSDIRELATGKFYDVTSFGKLILLEDYDKLTSAKLEGNVFVSISPAGITEDGTMKYFYSEYLITYQDTTDITVIFRKLLKEEGLKANLLTDVEKYIYYNRAVLEHTKNIRGELESATNKVALFINSHTYTADELKDNFKLKHGKELPELGTFGIDWLKHITTRLDARNVHNGYIVPLVLEEFQRENTITQTREEAKENMEASMQRVMNITDLLEPEETTTASETSSEEESLDEEEVDIEEDQSLDEDEIDIGEDHSLDEEEVDIEEDQSLDEEEIDIEEDQSLDTKSKVKSLHMPEFLKNHNRFVTLSDEEEGAFRFIDASDLGEEPAETIEPSTSWQATLDGDEFVPTEKTRYYFEAEDGDLHLPKSSAKVKGLK